MLLEDAFLNKHLETLQSNCIGSTGTRLIEVLKLAIKGKPLYGTLNTVKADNDLPLVFVAENSTFDNVLYKAVGRYTTDPITRA